MIEGSKFTQHFTQQLNISYDFCFLKDYYFINCLLGINAVLKILY